MERTYGGTKVRSIPITHDDRPMRAPPGGMTVEGNGSVTFRMGPGILGRFTVTATAGGVSRTLRFVAR